MFDKRVVRGNTYAAHILSANAQEEAERILQDQLRTKQLKELRRREKLDEEMRRPLTPPPVRGRHHIECQTDDYLEDLADIVRQADVTTQTEEYLDRPPSPLFMPVKTGVDAMTEVVEGELFNFDLEAQPVLEVLVGKAMEQSLMEVLEEEEIKNIRQQQFEFEQKRNAELAEVQRMEAEAKRKWEEKQKRAIQEGERVRKETELSTKIAARQMAKQILDEINNNVVRELIESGFFFDPIQKEVEDNFMPWIINEATVKLDWISISESMIDRIIQSAITKQRFFQSEKLRLLEEERQRRAEEKRRMEEEQVLMTAEEEEMKKIVAEEKEIDRKAEEERLAKLNAEEEEEDDDEEEE